MRALAGLDDWTLSESVGQTLKGLGFVYRKNQGRNVTEFEVVDPCHFLVTVENLTRKQMGFPLRSPIKVESAIEVRRTIGVREPESELKSCVSRFVSALRACISGEPWKGLGPVGSRREKAKWERLAEL